MIVSPYAKAGFTDHNVATNSSILAYAESVLGVEPVNEQDGECVRLRRSVRLQPVAHGAVQIQ